MEYECKPFIEIPRNVSPDKKKKKKWEDAFQRWSNEQAMDGTNPLGICGYGDMCNYCVDNTYGRPCVRALNRMLRETGKAVDYDDYDFEKVW